MTAVQWLWKQLSKKYAMGSRSIKDLYKEALEMEKQQKQVSNKEIREEAKRYASTIYMKSSFKDEWDAVKGDFITACKWYKKQLKQKKVK